MFRRVSMGAVALFMVSGFMVSGFMASGSALADTYNEVDDAGQLVGTAQSVTGVSLLTQIAGSVQPNAQDVDIYRILIDDFANFSADTLGTNAIDGLDTQLYLFDQNGFGIYANDDSGNPFGGGLDAALPAGHAAGPSSNGIYLLAVSSYNNEPLSADGAIFSPTGFPFQAIAIATGPGSGSALSGWNNHGGAFGSQTGDYIINLQGASVVSMPAPGAVMLAMLATPAIGWARRRYAA